MNISHLIASYAPAAYDTKPAPEHAAPQRP